MATANVTYTFIPADTIRSSEANANFASLVSFINTNAIQKDGTVAMTSPLTLAGDPTLANHASRKSYVDRYKTRSQSVLPTAGNWNSGDIISTITITDPGYDITVWVAGTLLAQANTLNFWEMQVYVDGVKTGGIVIPHANASVGQTYAVLGIPVNHVTGTNCSVQLKAFLANGTPGFATLPNTGANNLFTAWYTGT